MLKTVEPSKDIMSAREAVLALLRKDFDHLPPQEIVAVLSYTVGQTVALCDQRKFTPEMMMQLIETNLEMGNAHAVETLLGTTAGSA